jgi:hypothetical protein
MDRRVTASVRPIALNAETANLLIAALEEIERAAARVKAATCAEDALDYVVDRARAWTRLLRLLAPPASNQ